MTRFLLLLCLPGFLPACRSIGDADPMEPAVPASSNAGGSESRFYGGVEMVGEF